jgi:hypothetical protein
MVEPGLEAGQVVTISVGELLRHVEILERECECLRAALIDAGYSLRAERIARYASEAHGIS